jgi:hypothetical protein
MPAIQRHAFRSTLWSHLLLLLLLPWHEVNCLMVEHVHQPSPCHRMPPNICARLSLRVIVITPPPRCAGVRDTLLDQPAQPGRYVREVIICALVGGCGCCCNVATEVDFVNAAHWPLRLHCHQQRVHLQHDFWVQQLSSQLVGAAGQRASA